MTKSFLVIAAIFILVGGSIGGAFTGGVILGRNQAERKAPVTAQFTQSGGQVGQTAAIQQFADQIPLDEDGNPDFAALRQRAQAQGGGLPTPPGTDPNRRRRRFQRGSYRKCRLWPRLGTIRRRRNLRDHRVHRRRRSHHRHSPRPGGSLHKLGDSDPSLLHWRTGRPD